MTMVEEKQAIVFVRDEVAEVILLVATDKGAFLYFSDADRLHWDVSGPHFMGSVIHHIVLDPRDDKTLLASAQSRISGSTIFRSINFGKTWIAAKNPPEFPKSKLKRKVDHIFSLTPGHDSEKNVWYAGTSPQGLFRSEDGGETWISIDGFNQNADWKK